MEKEIITISGLLIIIGICWFFFGKREVEVTTKKVIVSGGYNPKNFIVTANSENIITFLRTDPNSCLEEIVIPDFGIKEYLPLNKEVKILIKPPKKGIYDIHCGMNMFHGTIKAI